MKNIFKTSMLFCLIACMLLSVVSCNITITPIETGTSDETADTTTPEGTTPEGTVPEETTPNYPKAPVPIESVGFQVVSETEDSYSFRVFIDSAEENAYIDLKPFFNGVLVPAMFPGASFDFVFATVEFLVDDKPADANTKISNGSIVTFRVKTTPEETTPEVTTPAETTPEETTPVDPDEGKAVYQVKVTDENQQPIAGVELILCFGNESISFPATAANGYTSLKVTEKDYIVRIIRADGYQFDTNVGYSFISDSGVSYITLAPIVVDNGSDMPEKVDLDGYVYKAYVRSNASTGDPTNDGNPAFYCEDFWINLAEGEPEDVLEWSVYHRNMDIENDYNVKIRQLTQTINMTQELVRYMQNQETLDLTIILAKSAAQAATQNMLKDLNGLSDLNLEHEGYDQNSIRELQMGGKLYYLSGDMNISTLDSVASTVVNLDLYENYADAIVWQFDVDPLYADIYKVVKAGKWTIDTMMTIAEIASVDADTTDGVLGSNPNDAIGYFQYSASAVYYFYGAGGRITQMNEDGFPEFVIQTNKNGDVFNYIFDKLHRTKRNIAYPHGFSGDRKQHFIMNADTLFTDMTLWDVRKDLYSNSTFNYGLLPIPVMKAGDDYHSVVYFYNTVHLWAIPGNYNDIDNAQLMMNVMAAYSNVHRETDEATMCAYYERTLSFSVVRNPAAYEILDIIKNSTIYDTALLYNWGGWGTELSQLWWRRDTNNHGNLVLDLPKVQTQLDETIEKFINPEGSIE